ncbi:hypothetical protein HYW46_00400 [Candidatus Daviesbacteria bacterium]|nr:hypothetical protein [Candidatus Daviesbacteria bacterium]
MSLLSNLSNLLPFSKKPSTDKYFFALNIGPERVEAMLWGIAGNRLQVISESTEKYASGEKLTQAANLALDTALADFQPEPEKILFGVPQSWLVDDSLKPECLKTLKQMVKDLGLAPMAYVSTVQAIAHYLQKLHGIPLTAVLVEVADPLTVSVIKAGKIVATKEQKRSGNLPEDIEKALLTFEDIEVLPSKILIHNIQTGSQKLSGSDELPDALPDGRQGRQTGGSAEKFKDELSSFPWMSQLPFLHLPKIEILEPETGSMSVCLAGAAEINPHLSFHATDIQLKGHEAKKSNPVQDLNFVVGDISDEESFGDGRRPEFNLPGEGRERYLPANRVDIYPSSIFQKIQKYLALPFFPAKKLPLFFTKYAIIFPVLALMLIVAAFLFLPKSKVTVFIDLRVLEKESTVVADPGLSQINEAEKTIPGKVVETTVTGSLKGTASGKKQIGDPARGNILIYNKTSAPKTFSQGTILTDAHGLAFTLDSSVSVASSSAVEGGIAFGKQAGNVTAVKIGPDSNLPAGSELAIKDQPTSSYSAKSDNAFSGGISKDVTVVTTEDQKKLLASLTSDLRKKAQEDLQGKLTGGLKILEEALSENIVNSTFSKGVNDQAQEFTLNMTVRYKGTAYKEDDLKMIVSKLVETNVPQGYELDLSKTETQAQVSEVKKDGKLIFVSKFRAKLSPKIDTEKIKKDLSGRTIEDAAERIKTIENVIGSNIELSPKLPIKQLQRLPFLPQNITIEVTAK